MASRHEIVTIDFRANAAKANPAMDSLRQACHDLNVEIEHNKKLREEGIKSGMAQSEIEKLDATIKGQLRTLNSYNNAINTLSKGVGTLARAIDAFNAGTLDKMNAAFQKQSFNAAENAKKLLVPGTEGYEKSMAELDALQQKNLENLAKYKLRTEQLLQSIGEGGKISSTDLKTEADGLEELMKLLPHLGNEWQEYYQILLRVRDAIKQQADEEKRLKGAIADANDARARSAQLTKQGAEEALQQHEAAKKEVEGHTAIINKLKEEQAEKKKNMAESAAILQQKDKEIESQKKTVATWETAIKNEKKDTKAREDRIIALQQENETLQKTADTNRKAADQMKGDMKDLEGQLKDVNAELEKMGASASEKPAPVTTPASSAPATAKKEETQAVEEKTEANKKEEQTVKDKTKAKKEETEASEEKTVAIEKETKAQEESSKTAEREKEKVEDLIAANQKLKTELDELYERRKKLLAQQKESIGADDEENPFKDWTKEQAQAEIDKMQQLSTFKKEKHGWQITNREEAQQFLFDALGGISPNNQGMATLSIENSPEEIKQLLGKFQSRYGLQSADDAKDAIFEIMSGGMIKNGYINNQFLNLEANLSKVSERSMDIKDLTAVIKGETEATKENLGVKKELDDIETQINAKEKESREISRRTILLKNGRTEAVEKETEKTEDLSAARKKSVEILRQTIEEYKKLSSEQAKAEVQSMKGVSKVGYEAGKLKMTNPEEVQNFLITRARAISGKKSSGGSISLKGEQADKLLEDFAARYGWSGDKVRAKELLKQVIQGKDGLFKGGGFADFGGANQAVTIKQNTEAVEKRNAKLQALTAIAEGAAKAIDKVSDATNGETDAIKIWEKEVERRRKRYDEMNSDLEKAKEHLSNLRKQRGRITNDLDGRLLKDAKDREIEEYQQRVYKPLRTQTEQLRKYWESSLKNYMVMTGHEVDETEKLVDVQDKETESVEKSVKGRGRKAKATKAAADAQKEQNKAEGESIAQGQQLSAEEQKKQDLLRKSNDLQGQINEKQEKANLLEEEAANADTKRENNLRTITNLQNENINAHNKNEQGYKREKENLEKLESQQDKNIHKYNEDKEAVEGLTQKIDEHATKRAEANKRAAQTERLTIDAMTDAIKVLEAENRAIDPQSAKWQENVKVIQLYKTEIDRLKNQPVLQMMTERMGNIRNLSADALAETKRFWQSMAAGAENGSHKLAVYEGNLKVIAEEERQRQQQIQAPMRERLNNLGRLSTADLTETKRYWQTVRDGADQTSAAYKKAELAVKALTNEENRRKANAQAQYINDQMKDLNNLSVSGLAEVKRYWQAMADGAKRGSDEAKDAEAALKRINELEGERRSAADKTQVRTLFGDLSKKGTDEIRAAIEAGRRLIDTYDSGSPAAQRLAQAIVDAEEHLKKYGVEAERAARREAAAVEEAAQKRREQDNLMRQQLDQGTALSESALKAQQQYWQRLIDDPKTAKESLAGYRYELERTIELQKQQTNATRDERAARLSNPARLGDYSTAEIREGIEAAKQLAASYQSGSREAQELTKNIVAAEEHLNKYSVETERAARKEAQAIAEMRQQLNLGTELTESALKAQENYWRRLADQPGQAADKVREYTANMKEAQELQTQLVADRGAGTLQRAQNGEFATANMADLSQAIKEIKEYQALIKDPDGAGKETFAAAKEQVDVLTARLNTLKGVAEKVKGTFASADEVLARFSEHMNAGKTSSEDLAKAFDEKLSQATSSYDEHIRNCTEVIEYYDRRIEEITNKLPDMQKKLADLEKKHASTPWYRRWTDEYSWDADEIKSLRKKIENYGKPTEDGISQAEHDKGYADWLKNARQEMQETLEQWKQWKAEEVGITEEVEEKKQDTQRLTQEQMQEGIKFLEEEYRKTDHTTAEGIKKREQLRQTIDQMNQEIKESTGEWMSYAEAEKFAAQAGTEGFIATGQQMKQAQEALERQRDTLIKSIQAKRQEKNMTDEQKKALAAEEAQLDKVNAELKKMKFEMDNTNMSAKRMNEILDNPSVAKNIEELGQAVKRAQAQLKMMEDTVGNTNKEYKEMAQKTKEAAQRQKELEVQFKASASAFDKAWSRLKTYVGLYVGASVAMQKLTGTMGDLMDLSDKMGEVRKTTGFTADEVGRLSGELKNFDTRTALNGLLDLSVAAGQLGLKTEEDVLGFTEAANKLMVALPEMGREGATEMLKVALATGEIDKIRKQMEQGLVEGSSATAVAMEKVGSTIDRLRATSAATAPAITDFVKRVGAVGAQSGISIDQVAALGSTVDALGMRVEMSATALSRMIPAIKNNAFAVAKAIKVEPETLRNLFETGRGMEAILMIFQHIKDSGMDADSIESMLGMGGMQEVMKELNQMGARAGIVFSGLSQNVDELRRQLGVANEAYEENLAIQQEYEKMNETTMAKWQRLKNELEEAFVGDTAQRWLGNIIEFLRIIVNLLTGNVHPALQLVTGAIHTFLVYWAVLKAGIGEAILVKAAAGLKAMGSGLMNLIPTTQAYIKYSALMSRAQMQLKAATDAASIALAKQKVAAIESRMAQEGLNKAMIANVWTAVAMAIMTAVYGLYHWIQNLRESAIEAGRFEAQVQKETKAANKLIDAIGEARVKIEDADKAVEKARKDLEEAKKANDGTTEAVKRLKDAEVELAVQEEKKRKALAEHKYMIEQFNNQYSKYLGFMLSEVASNIELANARDLVNSKLRETITLKQQEAGLERVEKEHGESRDEQYGKLKGLVYEQIKDPTKAARAMKELTDAARAFDNKAIDKTLRTYGIRFGRMQQAVWDYRNELKEIKDATDAVIEQYAGQAADDREVSQKNLARQADAAIVTYRKRLNTYKSARGNDRAKAAADVLKQMDTLEEMRKNASGYYKMDSSEQGKKEEARYKQQMRGLISWQGSDRDALLKVAGKYYTPRGTVNGDTTTSVKDPTGGGWGKDLPAESTDWKNMTAEQLVNRRKQMKDFVNAIQTDTDVQSVLKEDAALKAAIEKGMSSDMRTVIEWYNTERLKIQDELYSRHLTNTGDWRDPEKGKTAWRKQLQTDFDNYLRMLDAYYTERKSKIQEAGNDEGLTEAEVKSRMMANDVEWQQRRMELQQIYLGKRKQLAQEEVTDIMNILAEQDEDTPQMVEASINASLAKMKMFEEKAPEMAHRLESRFVSGVAQSTLKIQQIVAQQMKAIQDIIDKERPFNGITKNLRENLVTMGILTADMTKERNRLMTEKADMADFNARQAAEEVKRTAFMLSEAENAYSTTIEDVMRHMADRGMTAWADEMKANPKMQEGMMAQLRSTYDAIQDAIKKEASQLKKQAEIMWNNILMPDGQTTLKQQIDRIVAQLSLDESRVKRANSLIGAGQASERVADKLAIQQMKVQLAMQEHYYNLMRKRGQATVENLEKEAKAAKERLDWQQYEQKMLDAKHARMSLNLATAKEETELAKQREEIVARTEESQNRLYQELRSWADLLTSSLQGMFEAAHAGDAEYYNELAKMNLTGKGGPGAGTYIVIDDEGTEDATAHYEYLTEREALEREHEIEIQNARAEAWRKLMDDVNMKMSETITDQLNAMLQNKATEENTAELKSLQTKIGDEMGKMDASVEATNANTEAIRANTEAVLAAMNSKEGAATGIDTTIANGIGADMGVGSDGVPNALRAPAEGESGASAGTGVTAYTAPWQQPAQEQQTQGDGWLSPMMPLAPETDMEAFTAPWAAYAEMSSKTTKTVMENNKKQASSTSSMFAKMTQAANLYGVAYQAMSNDNLDTAQKFEMIALQAVGNAAIAGLGVALEEMGAKTAVNTAETASKDTAEHGSILGPILTALSTAVLGGLMGLATSKIAKSKSKIASITGANAGAGRLATGMLTYAEGNVNEFTDPASLTPGRRYNVDAADGRKYRARYMGSNPRTHITNGPEFHLSGEKGREMIIDAGTTRQITMNETEVWNAIKTLSGGGRIHHTLRRGRGVRAFADGNVEDFMGSGDIASYGAMGAEQMTAFQQSLDRNNELLERALTEGIKGVFDVFGKGGLVDSYDTGKRIVTRYGESY